MKIEKLFKKIENFFSLDEKEQAQNGEKREKIVSSLDKKIDSMKEKIKECTKKKKKEKLKKELSALMELREKM